MANKHLLKTGGLTTVQEESGKITDHNNSPIPIPGSKFVVSNGITHEKVVTIQVSNFLYAYLDTLFVLRCTERQVEGQLL